MLKVCPQSIWGPFRLKVGIITHLVVSNLLMCSFNLEVYSHIDKLKTQPCRVNTCVCALFELFVGLIRWVNLLKKNLFIF